MLTTCDFIWLPSVARTAAGPWKLFVYTLYLDNRRTNNSTPLPWIFQHTMSGKYVFSKALKELRFLHCQTSDHSNAVRYEPRNAKSSHVGFTEQC